MDGRSRPTAGLLRVFPGMASQGPYQHHIMPDLAQHSDFDSP